MHEAVGTAWVMVFWGRMWNLQRNQIVEILKITFVLFSLHEILRGQFNSSSILIFSATGSMSSMCWVLNKCLLSEYIFTRHRIVLSPKTSKFWGRLVDTEACMTSRKTRAVASASGVSLNEQIVAFISYPEAFSFYAWVKVDRPLSVRAGEMVQAKMYLI